MTFATLIIGDKDWLWPAIGAAVVGMLLLVWAYNKLKVSSGIAALLKGAGICLLAACLVNPLWSGTRPRPGANLFAVVVDQSQSMTMSDHESDKTRAEVIAELVERPEELPETANPDDWQLRLEQDFDVRRYEVDSRLHNVPAFVDVKFDGSSSSLNTTLQTLKERFRSRPLAGVMLFTDGNATDLADGQFDTSDLPPIYPVIVGDGKGLKDIQIDQVSVSQTSFEDAPVNIRVDASSFGYGGKNLLAQVIDEDGRTVESLKQIAPPNEDTPATFRFQIKPEKSGITFYKVRVAAAEEAGQFEDPETTKEATIDNNERMVKVDRGTKPYRILYVSGRPNWEFKFLRRAIEGDDQVDLVGMLRIAKREPKFDFRGRNDENTNPLFRGFKKDADEETESYDQPVIIRLNTKDEAELRDGFPKDERDLFGFDAVIVDDIEAGFFTGDQQAVLDKFVSRRGGGLMMLGGQESFRNGGYLRTPIGKMLPVYLDRGNIGEPDAEYRMELTREGFLQPWVRLRKTEDSEKDRLTEMPPFKTVNRIAAIKPGATVMASVLDGTGNRLPALVVQRFGRGRVGALTIGDLWRWRLRDTNVKANEPGKILDLSDQSKAWRQMIRWLVADIPQRIDVTAVPTPEVAPTATLLRVKVHDEEFQSLDNATVKITIKSPDGEPLVLEAEASTEEAGVYETTYIARSSGAFRASVEVADDDGEPVGTTETGWTSDTTKDEFARTAPNTKLMEELARATGGEVVRPENVEEFVSTLSGRDVPMKETWSYPIWHTPWVFGLAMLCFVGEWGLRRWKGLP